MKPQAIATVMGLAYSTVHRWYKFPAKELKEKISLLRPRKIRNLAYFKVKYNLSYVKLYDEFDMNCSRDYLAKTLGRSGLLVRRRKTLLSL